MKQSLRHGAILLLIFLQLFFVLPAFSQVQTARYISTSSNSNGFYEFLPAGYGVAGTKFPLIIFIHGIGELGNGVSDLPRVLQNGPPKIAAAGGYGPSFKFIILSPQFVLWPSTGDTDNLIEYAKTHYDVDISRIYLTGLSMGGGATWEYVGASPNYAKKLAAILPVCGAASPDITRAQYIAQANLPVWATHNQNDPTVPVSYTDGNIANINNQAPPPSPLAKKTIFPVSGHDAWSTTYSTSFTENGLNVYQWLLQFQNTSNAALPIVLGNYNAVLNGTKSVSIQWNTISETNNSHFIIDKSTDGTVFSMLEKVEATNHASGHQYSVIDNKPAPGNNFYRLSQIDKDGKSTYFNVLKIIVPLSSNQVSFQLMPNPVVSTLVIEMVNPSNGALQVVLSDVQGHQLRTWKFQKSNSFWQQSVDVSALPKGNYILQVKGNNINEVKRFIKQ